MGVISIPAYFFFWLSWSKADHNARFYRSITRAYEERYGDLPDRYLFNSKGKFQSRWGYGDEF